MTHRDLIITPTTSYTRVDSFITADSDQNDIGTEWQNVTLTNDTNQTLSFKSSNKSSVSGTGRTLLAGESYNFLNIKLNQLFIKVAAGTLTGKVIMSGDQV